ncbi:MAG: hypothetical protein HZA15_10540 [Nitrospirae bacterium]|nr:hypothetical protein [Nitrospirota bacterium]
MITKGLGTLQILLHGLGAKARKLVTSGSVIFPFVRTMIKGWLDTDKGAAVSVLGVSAQAEAGDIQVKAIKNLTTDELLLILLAI